MAVAVLARLCIDAEQVVIRAHLRADDDHDIDAALVCHLQERCEVVVFRGVRVRLVGTGACRGVEHRGECLGVEAVLDAPVVVGRAGLGVLKRLGAHGVPIRRLLGLVIDALDAAGAYVLQVAAQRQVVERGEHDAVEAVLRQRPRGGVELGLVDAQLAQTLAHIGLGLVADGVVVTESLVERVREARLERRGIFAAVDEPAGAHDERALLTRQALFLGKGAQGDGLPEALIVRLAHEHEVEAVVRGSKDLRGHLGHDACRRGELRGAEDDKRAVGHAGAHKVDAGRLCPRVHVAVVGVRI